MRLIFSTVLLIATFTASFAANGIILGYVTGNTYRTLGDSERMGWLIGVMDGIMAEDISNQTSSRVPWLGRCIDGLEKEQIKAIFEKELQAKPKAWHAPAALIFRDALGGFCATRK